MKLVLRIALCCSLAAVAGMAQRRAGGGGAGGGFRGGGGISRGFAGGGISRGFAGGGISRGFAGGGISRGFAGGGVSRGFTGGGVSRGFTGGGVSRGFTGGGVFRGGGMGIGRSWGSRGYYGGYYGGYGSYYGGYYSPYLYSGYGLGYGYSPWYNDYGDTSYPAYSYPAYQPSPNVTVVYAPPAPAQAPATVYVERPNPATREYDQYGQQTNRPASPADSASPALSWSYNGQWSNRPASPADSASPLYLIAFRDHSIRAAAAYWAEGATLHYITQEHEHKQAPLNTVDRDLSGQLNRERRVAFSLPASQ
jgi:hypothetical protein